MIIASLKFWNTLNTKCVTLDFIQSINNWWNQMIDPCRQTVDNMWVTWWIRNTGLALALAPLHDIIWLSLICGGFAWNGSATSQQFLLICVCESVPTMTLQIRSPDWWSLSWAYRHTSTSSVKEFRVSNRTSLSFHSASLRFHVRPV